MTARDAPLARLPRPPPARRLVGVFVFALLARLGLDAAQQASVSVEIDDEEDVPGGG